MRALFLNRPKKYARGSPPVNNLIDGFLQVIDNPTRNTKFGTQREQLVGPI
jgi:hypothetical protein